MSFTRVEQNGVEFFSETATGIGKISETGLARLCGITQQSMSERLQQTSTGKSVPECLKEFAGMPIPSQVTLKIDGYSINVILFSSEFCAAMIEYYAFEARNKTPEALFAYRKFAKMGIERWIQSITGWKPAIAASDLTEDLVIDFIADRLEPGMIAAGIQTDAVIDMLKRSEFTGAGYRLYFYLEMMHLQGETPDEQKICNDLNLSLATLRKWLPQVHAWSHCADWLQLQGRKGPEYPIQKRMSDELGGKMEAFTPAGRIDIVTDTEVIEIKRINHWKDAFGEVVVKGRYFPNHQKRIHLFGEAEKLKPTIVTTCEGMDIIVTFEPTILESATTDDPWADAA
jgi:hypothetical protein